MLTPAHIGIVVAILSVIAAYWVGYSGGVAAGQERGYDAGKREGAKEGSMRGYAVGYDRAKRRADGEVQSDEARPSARLSIGMVGLSLAAAAIFFLAVAGSRQKSLRSGPDSNRATPNSSSRPQLRSNGHKFGDREKADERRAFGARIDQQPSAPRDEWNTGEW